MSLHRIYFLQRADGLIKIGTTTNFQARLTALTKAHGMLGVIRIIHGDHKRERSLHAKFKRFHEYGEWFRPERGALLDLIEALDDGDHQPVSVSDAEAEWTAGEAELMTEARRKVAMLVKLRMERTQAKREAAQRAVTDEYGFSKYFLEHIRKGQASTVSAYGFKRLSEAYLAEMRAALAYYQDEMARIETDEDDADLLALGAKIDELIAHLADRKTGRA